MERFLVAAAARPSADASSSCNRRCETMVDQYQIHGRRLPCIQQWGLWQLTKSYSHVTSLSYDGSLPPFVSGTINGVEFDSAGKLFASVESTGNMYIHDYYSSFPCSAVPKVPVATFPIFYRLQAVRWSPYIQNEVACISAGENKVFCYNIRCCNPEPHEMYEPRVEMENEAKYFVDFKLRDSRIFACGHGGHGISVWDRRKSHLSISVLDAPAYAGSSLLCLDISKDEHVLYAGTASGHIIAWDLRGGRRSSAFTSSNQADHPPMAVLKVSSAMQKIPHLRSQTGTAAFSVTSISLNPSSGDQLAFGLNSGWSGVVDPSNLEDITHMHCPPPPWDLETEVREPGIRSGLLNTKLTWLLDVPAVVVSNSSDDCELRFLDFSPGQSSRHHVLNERVDNNKNNRAPVVLKLPEPVSSLATHPFDGSVIAGTLGYAHLIAQQMVSKKSKKNKNKNNYRHVGS